MIYKVRLTAHAETDAYTAFDRIREAAPRSAEKWLHELFAAIQSLERMPNRCLVIPEAEQLGHEVRQLLYGKRNGIFRIIFDILESSEEGSCVRVLRIWHGARDTITALDIETEY